MHACSCHDPQCSSTSCRKVSWGFAWTLAPLVVTTSLRAASSAPANQIPWSGRPPFLDLLAELNWPGLLVCCARISLLQVRQLFQHAVGCQQKVTGGCGLCKKMWCLLNLHAKSCTTTNCPVPRCRCDMFDSAV